ncbi:hypothetical protein AB1Y20_008016 [Prymnesium parvum]|uniref:Uncharacterized protein n=1 Tax=Prymnesium parvum TaxID=97485 RepID=A0AB34ITS7_PRYPA
MDYAAFQNLNVIRPDHYCRLLIKVYRVWLGKQKQKTSDPRVPRPNGKKGITKERQYELDDLRRMATQVLPGEMPSAGRAATRAAGLWMLHAAEQIRISSFMFSRSDVARATIDV